MVMGVALNLDAITRLYKTDKSWWSFNHGSNIDIVLIEDDSREL